MSDNMRHPSRSRKAGRGLWRALRGLLGDAALERARESWQVLKREFREGREGDGPSAGPPPRRIAHREKPLEGAGDEPP